MDHDTVFYHCIPREIADLPQWVLWRMETRGGRLTKVPFRADGTGALASTIDPSHWDTLWNARRAKLDYAWADLHREPFHGVGFVFTKDDPYVGIDLDHCRGEDWADDLLRMFRTYQEISPSWLGYHIIGRGCLPGGLGKRKGQIEVYDRGRFFCCTGRCPPTSENGVFDIQGPLEILFDLVLNPPPLVKRVPRPAPAEQDDEEVIKRAVKARNGYEVQRLYAGDSSRYQSPSEADAALISLLIPYTRDRIQLDRLFRNSGLMREKWDERHGDKTYGDLTIEKQLGFVVFDARQSPPDTIPWWDRPSL